MSLGQFYTTHADKILSCIGIPIEVKVVVEPFVGKGDLLAWVQSKTSATFEIYDIDPQLPECPQRDTLDNPPDYRDKFVVTNPQYLAKNKSPQTGRLLQDFYSPFNIHAPDRWYHYHSI